MTQRWWLISDNSWGVLFKNGSLFTAFFSVWRMWLSQHLFYQASSLWNGAMRNIHHISSKKIKWMEIVQVDNPIGNNNLKVICLLTCAGQGDFNSIFCRGVSMDSGSFDSPSRGMIYAKKGIICWLKISEQFEWKSLVNERLSYKLRFAPVLVWYHLFFILFWYL